MNEQAQFDFLLQYYGIFQPDEIYKVVCPFHADKNASLQINRGTQFWYCYGCGQHGGIIELYQAFEALKGRKVNSLQASIEVRRLKGTDAYNNISYNSSIVPFVEKASYKEGLQIARDFYFNLPQTNWFKPGCEEGIEAKRYMHHRGFSAMALKKAAAKVSYNRWYPIVFPMFENGIFRGYVMRTFDPEIEAKRKYMYNKGFKRERCLPGTYGIKQFDGSLGTSVVLVEGFLDKLKANQLGIANAAAILGWKLSQKQIEKLKRAGIKLLICATDSDEAGMKGYRYMKRIADSVGFSVCRLRYPKGCKDMGDVQANTKQAEHVLSQIKKFQKCMYIS